jgi:MoaA/NifB/PqqE/SkfB family radical SAM enzyme
LQESTDTMATQMSATAHLNQGLRIFFSEFVRVSLRRPSQAPFFGRTVLWQGRAARVRARNAREGLTVPPIAIFSITNRCNLRCKGCYAQAIRREAPEELSAVKLREIIAEADALGVSFFVIAGGEPLTRPEILDITRDFPHIIFLLVTNGLLLDGALIARLAGQQNMVPTLSLEGNQAETDERRGHGVHQGLQRKMEELKAAGIFFSISLTVTRANFGTVTERRFVQSAVASGCRLFFFLEYTPIREGTEDWVITDSQREQMKGLVASFRKRFPAVFIAVPWDEEQTGGCLASGRGFVHISASGDLEPCPFAPYSDTNLREVSLEQGLRSPFLTAMRANHQQFAETEGGCALWKNREQVRAMLAGQTGTTGCHIPAAQAAMEPQNRPNPGEP